MGPQLGLPWSVAGVCENHAEGLTPNILHELEFILCFPNPEAGRGHGLVPGWWPCVYQVCGFVEGSAYAWDTTGPQASLRPVLIVTRGREKTLISLAARWVGM